MERTIEQPVAGAIPVDPRCRLVISEGNYLLHDGPWAGAREWVARVDEANARAILGRAHRADRTIDVSVVADPTPHP
ncbi:nucleoside/nucleotide kinase family protein [Tsukamurella soli]|uniref:DUF2849 domain-containing protein n=1 Tax=Tsukamurella soli TaxID=644556 RepID=A0ABP8J160_9ACTN